MAAINLRTLADLTELRRRLGQPAVSVADDAAAARALVLPPGVGHVAFTETTMHLAALCGYRTAHFRASLDRGQWRTAVGGDGAGFPDLLLIHPARRHLVAAELKTGRGRLTTAQRQWLDAFAAIGAAAYVWYPRDWETMKGVLLGESEGGQ